jgi:heterodisulfide reductase subunit A
MYIAKHAIIMKEHYPDVQCYVFYMDVRAVSKDYEEFYKRAQESGAIYIRGKVSGIRQEDGRLVVRGEDTLLGEMVEIPADMVVLAIGMEHSPGSAELAQALKVSYDINELFIEAHPKLRPVETMSDGVFVAGACVGPRDIPESVASGGAAAAKVAALFSQEFLTTDPMVASVDQMKCGGCLLCTKVCPFKAIDTQVLRDGRTVAVVNESLCKGCGLCVASCRFGAANLRGFTQQQLLAEVTSLWQ